VTWAEKLSVACNPTYPAAQVGADIGHGYEIAPGHDAFIRYERFGADTAGFGFVDPELFGPDEAKIRITYPHQSLQKIAELGPFSLCESALSWKHLLEEKGLAPFFRAMSTHPALFQAGVSQVLEELFAWEQREGFSFEG